MEEFWHWILHADENIADWVRDYGALTYLIVAAIIFVETGLVVVIFFPGDALLFSAGVLAAAGQLDLAFLLILLSAATFLGNTSNYFIGRYVGGRLLHKSRLAAYLARAHRFYERFGAPAVALSRFFPFMRSLVPFVAGITAMPFPLFSLYNALGGVAWIAAYLAAGYFFGEIPWVQQNYGLVFFGLMVLVLAGFLAGIFNEIRKRK